MFSEFAYGYAVVSELELVMARAGLHAPFFPTQRLEKRVGYDVAMNWAGACLFLQFKRSEEQIGRRCKLRRLLPRPYYRFPVTPRKKSPQHDVLIDLANRVARWGHEVAYCAPLFTLYTSLDRHFQNLSVLANSVYIQLAGEPPLPDDEQHYYNTDPAVRATYFSSEEFRETKGRIAINAVAEIADRARPNSHDEVGTLQAFREIGNIIVEFANLLQRSEPETEELEQRVSEESRLPSDPTVIELIAAIQSKALSALDIAWFPIMQCVNK